MTAVPSPAPGPLLETERLRLRRWREADREPFAALNADPEVTRYLRAPLSRAESDALILRIEAGFEAHGMGLWAVEVAEGAAFVGFVGLSVPAFDAPFTPCVEIGWRLARAHWGQGYATEAARAALDYGVRVKGLEEILSFTVPANKRSRAVMTRLGFHEDPQAGFDHPSLPLGHALRRHVLYRCRRPLGS